MVHSKSLNIWVQTSIIVASFLIVYQHTIIKLVKDWTLDDNFSHGFLIPFITAYMIWYRTNILKNIKTESSNWGYLLLMFGMGLHVAGNIGAELFTMRFSMIIALMGLTLIAFGNRIFKYILVPLAYLIFMVPIPAILWNKIAFPLQQLAAKLSSDVISLLGMSVLREGNILHLPNTSLEVVDACSGLRSLTSMIALSAAFAFISTLKTPGKWVLFFSAIPIAIVVNIVRLTVTAILARYFGPETAQGFLHDLSGMVIFVVALVLLYFTHHMLSRSGMFAENSESRIQKSEARRKD